MHPCLAGRSQTSTDFESEYDDDDEDVTTMMIKIRTKNSRGGGNNITNHKVGTHVFVKIRDSLESFIYYCMPAILNTVGIVVFHSVCNVCL